MASMPQFYSDYSLLSSDFSQFPFEAAVAGENSGVSTSDGTNVSSGGTICSGNGSGGGAMWISEENNCFPVSFVDNGLLLPPESDVGCAAAPVVMSPFPEQLGVSEAVVPTTLMPEFNVGFCGINEFSGVQNFGGRYDHHHQQQLLHVPNIKNVCEFGDECCGFMQDFKPMYPSVGENWGNQNNGMSPGTEEGNAKVGRYSVEERRDRIHRYLKKKNQRNFNKTIKYACRKTLADRRVRIRGRFARNNELITGEEMAMKNDIMNNIDHNSSDIHKDKEFYSTNPFQVKEDEEWLQEAMASLMYLPYIS